MKQVFKIKKTCYASGKVTYTPMLGEYVGLFHFIMDRGYRWVSGPECCLLTTAQDTIKRWKNDFSQSEIVQETYIED